MHIRPFGIAVMVVTHCPPNEKKVMLLRNVTEIHYRYNGENMCAFESEVHKTGVTIALDNLVEFETHVLETEKASTFSTILD